MENCHAGYQTVGIAVNALNLYSLGSYPEKVSPYEFHLLHENGATTLHITNDPLMCENFGFLSGVPKESGLLACGIQVSLGQ